MSSPTVAVRLNFCRVTNDTGLIGTAGARGGVVAEGSTGVEKRGTLFGW